MSFYNNSQHHPEPAPEQKSASSSTQQQPASSTKPFYANSQHSDTAPKQQQPSTLVTTGEPPKPEQSTPAVQVNVPDAVRELRKSDASLFDAEGMYRDALGTPGTSQDIFAGQPQEVRAEVAQMFRDNGLSSAEAREIVEHVRTTAEPTAQELRDTERYLQTVDPSDAALAVKLLERDPRIERVLGARVNHPKVVRMLIEKARSERARGRLK